MPLAPETAHPKTQACKMQKHDNELLFSASDVVNFLECEHLTSLDIIDLETPLPKTEDDDEARLIQVKGHAHEAAFVETLKARHATFFDVAQVGGSLEKKVESTLAAMHEGVEVIYQAALHDGRLVGHADFLRRVPWPSGLGDFSYEVLDTKLSRSPKAKFLVQLAFYSALVAKVQRSHPLRMHVVLGDQTEKAYRCADYARYFANLKERFLARMDNGFATTYPDPCERCDLCKYRDFCEARRRQDDHLCQVANITKLQTKKLQAAGITTLAALATLSNEAKVPKMVPETLEKLRQQAALQHRARLTGENHLELLPRDEEGLRGLARLPRPHPGDLFFDMEGDPFEEGGLEYLFGLYYIESGKPKFRAFWAHSRAEEKRAFEDFIDFVTAKLRACPGAHIYHYAHYEPTALKKLMSVHGTREAEVDNLLRTSKFIDLYKVVREGIRVSEPRYSIKNIERFYLQGRTGEVKSAGASIVYYERWKEMRDPLLLKEIEEYNYDDVRSTYELREWLLGLRPTGLPWARASADDAAKETPEVGELTQDEKRLIPYRQQLIDPLPADRLTWGMREYLHELTYQLLDFHRRAAKPEWWAMFARAEMTEEELFEDGECLAGLTLDPDNPPRPEKRSIRYTYAFPEQESKLKTGDNAVWVKTFARLTDLVIDEESRKVTFKYSTKNEPLPAQISIGPGGPVSTDSLKGALFRFAESLLAQDQRYAAIEAVLNQELPRLAGYQLGRPIVDDTREPLAQIIETISKLDGSYIFVQGPPGAGKTYTGSHVIVSLMKQGYRVGVSSNSHKAINNLLDGVEKVAKADGFSFRGAKKSTAGKPDSMLNGDVIEDVFDNEEAISEGYQLIAGTAWLFADEALDQFLDYLFVDEAGQVALANLVAMGTSARNIVLLGDQMQLGQPIQGAHPGRSGESSLEYLLNGMATIPPERGIFLKTTWRMHPDVCRFISDAVYDGRLEPEPANHKQMLVLGPDAHPALAPTGVRFLPAEHDACSQRSIEEAALVKELVESLLKQRFRDKKGVEHVMGLDNILVVAPYNMHVNLLKATLPADARVGTVDKFQGQEAEVVIVSMATSSGEYLPRYIEFLYSKNRLNVAISRAKCLALFIANPSLMTIRCSTPEDMALVNTLCWVRDYGR